MGTNLMRALLLTSASVAMVATAAPTVAYAQEATYQIDIPAQSMGDALRALGKATKQNIVFNGSLVKGKRSAAVRGRMSASEALDRMLQGSGLKMSRGAGGGLVVAQGGNGAAEAAVEENYGATPEILVVGRRDWSLNTDIRRTRDDAQPYQVFDREEIQRSGVNSLDEFFRDFLNANVGGAYSTANGGAGDQPTRINIRGLGADETLILIDGRRPASVNRGGNAGDGVIGQPPINGIPIAAIERIEVLPASASGIYGGSATGGVVNIVLKRDYSGIEASANYGSTYSGGGRNHRIDVSAGTNLFGGGTNIMFTGSWQKSYAFNYGDASFLTDYARRTAAFDSSRIPVGATPNLRSSNGAPLRFDVNPAFGTLSGALLSSGFTFVPYGYRGFALDGVAGLAANAGQYNFDLAPTTQSGVNSRGRDFPLNNGTDTLSGLLAIRQEVTPWLKAFAEVAADRVKGRNVGVQTGTDITLAANAPSNPFQQTINVRIPFIIDDPWVDYERKSLRATGGLIANLPFGWQGSADYSWNRSWLSFESPRSVSQTQVNQLNGCLTCGAIDVLRDLIANPISYDLVTGSTSFSRSRPATSTNIALRLAGPLPLSLPGGKPTLTVQAQRARTGFSDAIIYSSIANQFSSSGSIRYQPSRTQVTDSVYVEGRIPLISPANDVDFVHSLEFQIASRYERYTVNGAFDSITCLQVSRPLTDADIAAPCPPANTVIQRGRSSKSALNPTFSVKWQPASDLTLRASYSTGYRPPDANQLIPSASNMVTIGVTDPLRGNEAIGIPILPGLNSVAGRSGGNPNVRPEHSTSYTAGFILTPQGIPNLRLSIDWNRIIKRDNYYSPTLLLLGASGIVGTPLQTLFNDFLAAHPERFQRSGNLGAFSVAPISFIDATTINLAGSKVGAFDFAADYNSKFAGGNLDFAMSASWLYDFQVKTTPNAPSVQWTGVAGQTFFDAGGGAGGPEWKGNASIRYSNDIWSIGARARYYGGYWLNTEHNIVPAQGSNRVPAQVYFDLFGSYRLFKNTELSAGVRNIFDKRPPYDVSGTTWYSQLGDPRGGVYYTKISQKF